LALKVGQPISNLEGNPFPILPGFKLTFPGNQGIGLLHFGFFFLMWEGTKAFHLGLLKAGLGRMG